MKIMALVHTGLIILSIVIGLIGVLFVLWLIGMFIDGRRLRRKAEWEAAVNRIRLSPDPDVKEMVEYFEHCGRYPKDSNEAKPTNYGGTR